LATGAQPRRRTRALVFVLAAAVSATALLGTPAVASAHLTYTQSLWTYRYYTRGAGDPQCNVDSHNLLDPLNIVTYQYGEAARMFDHIMNETDWYNVSYGSDQVICWTTGSGYGTQGDYDQAVGHGPNPATGDQAHFRLFPAGHVHPNIVDKFSVADFHHEDYGGSFHNPDEDWEVWEEHVAGEMDGHNIYHDYYYRVTHSYWRGWADNGYTTRIGGLHNGGY
jgi:hypothetical protein